VLDHAVLGQIAVHTVLAGEMCRQDDPWYGGYRLRTDWPVLHAVARACVRAAQFFGWKSMDLSVRKSGGKMKADHVSIPQRICPEQVMSARAGTGRGRDPGNVRPPGRDSAGLQISASAARAYC